MESERVPLRFHVWTGLGLLIVIAFYSILKLSEPGTVLRDQATTWGQILVPLIGVHLCFSGQISIRNDFTALVPRILGFVSIFASLGALSATVENLLPLDWTPFPSDVISMMPPLLLAIAILLWPSRQIPRMAIPKILADAMIFYFGLASVVWILGVGPLVDMGNGLVYSTYDIGSRLVRMSGVEVFLTAVSPLLDLLMIVMLVLAVWRGVPMAIRPATWLVAAAVAALAIGDTMFSINRLAGRSPSEEQFATLLVMWPFACVLCNIAGGWVRYAFQTWPDQLENDAPLWQRPQTSKWMQAAPTLFLPICAGMVAYAMNAKPSVFVQNGLYVFVFLWMVGIIAHQLLAILENNHLYMGLNEAYLELGRSRTKLAMQYDELEEANSRLARLALLDGLTGLWNHRAFFEELERAQRELPAPLSVLLIDVDFFKQYNDEFGHPAGDKTLRDVARAIKDALPVKSFAAKFGGDEYAVLLRGSAAKNTATVADQIRSAVAGCEVAHRPVTVSIGYVEWRISMSIDEVIEAADRSLYAAKSIGKNMVFGGSVKDLPTFALVEAANAKEANLDSPLSVGRIIVDGLRCDPVAVEIEPSAPLVGGLLATLEMADPDTRRHSERVMWFSLSFAEHLLQIGWNFGKEDYRALAYGALLHDIGKIQIPGTVLRSTDDTDKAGRDLMNAHPILGADLVAAFSDLEPCLDIIRSHHERWDGEGYPLGLAGDQIGLTARIFSLVDVMDDLASNRPYKPQLEWHQIVAKIRAETGGHFDPDLVEPFLSIPKEHWDSLRRTQYRIVAPLSGHK